MFIVLIKITTLNSNIYAEKKTFWYVTVEDSSFIK